MKREFLAALLFLLAACNPKNSTLPEGELYTVDNQTIEAPALEDWEFGAYGQIGYYSLEVDSTIKDFVYFDCDSIKQVVISYYSEPTNLRAIHLAIDELIIAKGWRYPLEDWHDFEEQLQAMLGDNISYRLGEVEIDID
ncbi:MAG: hypothetical protein IKK52_01995 [Alphaproteobacteria bacterium]|nr:hypothetical protein [Alphaproteobacteria bacterium]